MMETVLEMPLPQTSDALSSAVTEQTTRIGARGRGSLMTPLGLATGEVWIEVDALGAITLRQLVRKLDWPVQLVMLGVGVLLWQGLVRATQRELEVLVEPIPEWSRVVQAEMM